MGERRKYPRSEARDYSHVFDRNSNDLLGRLANLSTEGIMITGPESVQVNTTLKCRVELPAELEAGNELHFDVRSIWCKQDPNTQDYNTGCYFVNIALKDLEVLERLTQHPAFQR